MDAKIALTQHVHRLMPDGKPDLWQVRQAQTVKNLARKDRAQMTKILFAVIKDFCGTFNVVRNMSETQMIEAASMLIEEAADYRIEDFIIMFALAKRGKFVKIYDRIDAGILMQIANAYWQPRSRAMSKLDEESEAMYREQAMKRQLEREASGEVKDYLPQLTALVEQLCGKKVDATPESEIEAEMKKIKIAAMQKQKPIVSEEQAAKEWQEYNSRRA